MTPKRHPAVKYLTKCLTYLLDSRSGFTAGLNLSVTFSANRSSLANSRTNLCGSIEGGHTWKKKIILLEFSKLIESHFFLLCNLRINVLHLKCFNNLSFADLDNSISIF